MAQAEPVEDEALESPDILDDQQVAESVPESERYTETTWSGLPAFACNYCAHVTTGPEAEKTMQAHVRYH